MTKNRALVSGILAASTTLALACGSRPPPPAPAPTPVVVQDHYSGHWEGAAQIASSIAGAPQQMDIVAVLVEGGGGQCGTIEYSHAGCSGIWSCVGTDYSGEVLQIQETIRFGGERCPTGANIELRRTADPNILEFRYSHAAIQAAGQINRRRIQ